VVKGPLVNEMRHFYTARSLLLPGVRPSVCPSVTLVHCVHTAEDDMVKLLVRFGSIITLVFWPYAPIPNSKGTLSAEAQNTRGWENFAIFNGYHRLSWKRYEIWNV